MSQFNPPARTVAVTGSVIATADTTHNTANTVYTADTIAPANTIAPAHAIDTASTIHITDTVPPPGSIQTADVLPAGRTRSARLRQITVLGVFSSVAMVSVRVPAVIIVPVMIVVLAGIDIVGGIVAKSWALGRSPWAFAAGVVLFVLLFWVYGMSLRHGELSTITIGWVVLVTLADMGLDRFHYDVHFPLSKWLAALGAVALLAYLLIDTDGSTDPSRSTSPPTSPSTTHTTAPSTPPTTAPATSVSTVPATPPIDSGSH